MKREPERPVLFSTLRRLWREETKSKWLILLIAISIIPAGFAFEEFGFDLRDLIPRLADGGLQAIYPTDRTWAIVFAIVFGIAAVAAVIAWYFKSASKNWPMVHGNIIACWITSAGTAQPSGEKYGEYEKYEKSYVVNVVYRYSVFGREHKSKRLSFDTNSYPEQEARTIRDRYTAGTEVPVFYDPDQPDRAVLENKTVSWHDRLYGRYQDGHAAE